VIVSHDINLSLRFANKIILISREDVIGDSKTHSKIGLINNNNAYVKNSDGNWSCRNNEELVISPNEFKEILISKFS
jgi:ABC-type cobalamin/Fe3+-siderophores transport system ATPase subunit